MSLNSGSALRLIELGRWAPSGDNEQPWRFEVLTDDHLVVHCHDTRDHCVYDLDGHSSQLAIGALIETLHIAASEQGLQLRVLRRIEAPDAHPTFDVCLQEAPDIAPDPLLPAIPRRSVYRRPMSPRALREDELQMLTRAMPSGYSLRWFAGLGERWRMAQLMFANAKLRLTMREAYEVHRSIIDWGQRFSEARVPDQALGVDALTLRVMRWALADWRRVTFSNRWLAGTLAPRLQMDLLPSMLCAAHVAITAEREPRSIDDYVAAGRTVQRLWLSATLLGLQHQPEMTPLIFTRYVRQNRRFSSDTLSQRLAERLAGQTSELFGPQLPCVAWLGRIGAASPAESRSLRHSASRLMQRAR